MEIKNALHNFSLRLTRGISAFRQPIVTIPETHGTSIHTRTIDTNAANLMVAHDKVLQILDGKIPLPETVELFITNFCNFACSHCRCAAYHGDNTQFLNVGTTEKLLIDLAEKGIKTIELGGGGEPLEHPQIKEMFNLFNKYAFRVSLITNGYRFTREPGLIDSFSNFGDWARFSLDGISNDSFRAIHGRKDIRYDVLREAIIAMVNKTKAKHTVDQRPKIGIKLIIQKPNQHEVLNAIEEAQNLGVHYIQFKLLENHPFSLGKERINLIHELTAQAEAVDPQKLFVDILPGYGGKEVHERCLMGVLHPVIDWDGEIYMCAFFHDRKEKHSIGNINDGGFFAHWASQKHKEKMEQVDPQKCVSNCPMLRYNPVTEFIKTDAFRFRHI